MDRGELINGSLKNRPGTIKAVSDRPDMFGKNAAECYCSIYRFGEDFTHPKGYTGPCRATGLHFDLDSNDGGVLALDEARRLVERLCSADYGFCIDDLDIYFSGRKGFHLLAANDETRSIVPSIDVPGIVKKIALGCAEGLATVDNQVYDRTRVLRVANSRHAGSGLFKIPLYAAEVYDLSVEGIRELAREQRNLRDATTVRAFLNGVMQWVS